RSLRAAVVWVQQHRYRAYEPADGNASPLFALTRGRVLPMRVLQQVVLRAPVNIRPWLGIAPHESAIGRGYMAWAYVLMSARTGGPRLAGEAVACVAGLGRDASRRSGGMAGGDPYEYATRGGRWPHGEPLLIWTALIGQAFLDAYVVWREERYLRVARDAGD